MVLANSFFNKAGAKGNRPKRRLEIKKPRFSRLPLSRFFMVRLELFYFAGLVRNDLVLLRQQFFIQLNDRFKRMIDLVVNMYRSDRLIIDLMDVITGSGHMVHKGGVVRQV